MEVLVDLSWHDWSFPFLTGFLAFFNVSLQHVFIKLPWFSITYWVNVNKYWTAFFVSSGKCIHVQFAIFTRTHTHLCASVQWGFPYRFEKRQHIWSIKWVLWDCGSNIDSSKVNIASNWGGQRWWSVTKLFGYLMALWRASLSARKIINGAAWRTRQVHIKPVIWDIDTE